MTSEFPPETALKSGKTLSSGYLPSVNRASILLFSLVNFLWWIGLYLYVPIFPVYIQETGAGLGTIGVILYLLHSPHLEQSRGDIALDADMIFQHLFGFLDIGGIKTSQQFPPGEFQQIFQA